ncbi:MAG: sugar porter family MFS transporter [Calditrichaceae bacterium]|nr:sugar porter family MFS transporter [Calditrichaceae bacterium]
MEVNKRYVIFVSLVVALGGFLMGFDASVISGVVKFIEIEFDLSKLELGWAVSSLTLSATLAMMLAGPLSDRYGRKPLLQISAILYLISAITSAIAPTFWFLVAARMLGGFGVGASLILAPMYIAEISPAKLRGTMVSFNQLNIVIGISVAFFTNYLILQLGNSELGWAQSLKFDAYNWRWMLGLESFPALFYFLSLLVVPESPRWLVMKGDEIAGLSILSRVNGQTKAGEEIRAIRASMTSHVEKKKVPISSLFKPALKLVLLIGVVIAILQQITGINSVFFYAPMIFEQSGIGTDASFSQAILVGLTNLVFTVLAMLLIDKLGRKPLLVVGVTGIALAMFLLAYGFGTATYKLTDESIKELPEAISQESLTALIDKSFDSDVAFKEALAKQLDAQIVKEHESALITAAIKMNPYLILIGIIGFVASFAVSLGPVMWVMFSELFPNWIRGLAISFAGFINSAISFLVQLVFPWELANFGSATTFMIYGIFAVAGLVFIFTIVPETKGKSLEELEKILVK